MTLPFFKNRKSRRELERELLRLRVDYDKSLCAQAATLEEIRNRDSSTVKEMLRLQRELSDLEKEKAHSGCHYQSEIESLMGKISELESQPKPLAKIELVPSLNLTLAKWLKEENLIASAATILKHPDMRAMLDVLRNEHPGKKGLAITATMEQRAAYQAETQGYERCLSYLQALGEKPKKKTEIEETFAEENVGGKR